MSDLLAAASPAADAATTAATRLADFLRGDLGMEGPVALHEPSFEGNEWTYVKDCLDTGWVSSAGTYVERIERLTADACGAAHGVAVVNGTAGLHAALLAVGVRSGDAVVCPALTFIATANAISYCGAAPLFVDIDAATGGIDAATLSTLLEDGCDMASDGLVHKASGRRIAAILPVHLFGHPADMVALCAVATEFGLPVIEDAAEALGSRHHGRACGGLGTVGVVSFNGNKTVTTGGGGMIVTDDETLATRLKHLTTTARLPDRWWFDHDAVGYNYRMPNINAALGCAQLELLPRFIARKRELAARYAELFRDVDGVTVFAEPVGSESNFWLNALMFDDAPARDSFLARTNDADIQTRPCWRLIPDTAAYADAPRSGDLATARSFVDRLVNIPSGPRLLRGTEA
ncbi:MAG: aminotransferase DegT [Rhodospirillales bacterium CG15_BIG_FIL_POST_REV_8_21_14_020_66_15]|nr:MAG: aminotransferase DegT [Rhodospirillales bacterium CG15_BIG_FIL_POST_REV_8_21_14_020_66_15]